MTTWIEAEEASKNVEREIKKLVTAKTVNQRNSLGAQCLLASQGRLRKVTKSWQAAPLVKEAQRNPYKGYVIPSLNVQAKRIVPGVQAVTANILSPSIERYMEERYLPTLAGELYAQRVFPGMLYLSAEDSVQFFTSIVNFAMEDGKFVNHSLHLVDYDWTDETGAHLKTLECVERVHNGEEGLYIVNTGEWARKEDIFQRADGSVRDRWTFDLQYSISSAGMLKKEGCMCFGTYEGADQSKVIDWATIIDHATGGAWKMLCDENKTEFTPQQLAQLAMRLAQFFAPASVKTEDTPVPVELNMPGVMTITDPVTGEKKMAHADGQFYLLAMYVAIVLQDVANTTGKQMLVTEEAGVGLAMQCRPHSVYKGVGVGVQTSLLKNLIQRYCNGLELVVINGDTASLEERRAYWKYASTKGQEGPLAGKAIMVVWPSELAKYQGWPTMTLCGRKVPVPAIFGDFNAQKTGFDVSMKSGLRILAAAHHDHDDGNMSVQTLQSTLYGDFDRACAWMRELAYGMVTRKAEQVFSCEGKSPSAGDFMVDGNIDYSKITGKAAPCMNKEFYAPGFRGEVDKSNQSLARHISNNNYSIKVHHEMIGPDAFAVFAGVQVLGVTSLNGADDVVQIYTNDLPAGTVGIANRFPKAGSREFLKVVVVSLDEMRTMAINKGLDENLVDEIMYFIQHISDGYTFIPAMSVILKLIGGADYDGDTFYICTEPTQVDILWTVQSLSIDKE